MKLSMKIHLKYPRQKYTDLFGNSTKNKRAVKITEKKREDISKVTDAHHPSFALILCH